jgi:ribonuclease HII
VLKSYYKRNGIEAGCDEAGRGCLAGPVFAAAVILPKNFSNELLNDSKQINEHNRYELREVIEKNAIAYAVSQVNAKTIDKINILRASIRGMHLALDKIDHKIDRILVDGNRFYPYLEVEHHCIIKGDGIYASIAAASILAKTYRDDYMIKMDKKYPGYNFIQHKGYPTEEHRQAILDLGICDLHRKSFKLLPDPVLLTLFDQY